MILATPAQGADGAFTLPDGTMMCLTDAGSVIYRDGTVFTLDTWLTEHNIELYAGPNLIRDASTSGKVMIGGSRSGAGFMPIIVCL